MNKEKMLSKEKLQNAFKLFDEVNNFFIFVFQRFFRIKMVLFRSMNLKTYFAMRIKSPIMFGKK